MPVKFNAYAATFPRSDNTLVALFKNNQIIFTSITPKVIGEGKKRRTNVSLILSGMSMQIPVEEPKALIL